MLMSGKQGYPVQQGNGRRANNAVKKGRNAGTKKAKPKKEDEFNWRCDDADEEPEPVLPGGYKSVKSRWLSNFEKEQKEREAAERAAAEAKRKADADRLLREAEQQAQEEAARMAEQAAALAAEQEKLRQEEEERARLEAEAAAARREEALARERELKEQRQREKDERLNREARARMEQIRLEKEAAALRIKEAEIRAAAAAAEAAAAALKEQELARERERDEEDDDDDDDEDGVAKADTGEEAPLDAKVEAAREEAEVEIRETAENRAKLEIANSVMRDAELDTEMPLMEETSSLRGDDRAGAEEPSQVERAPKADPPSADGRAGGAGSPKRRKREGTPAEDADERPAKQVKREVASATEPPSEAKNEDKFPIALPSKAEPFRPPKPPIVKAEDGDPKVFGSNSSQAAKPHPVKTEQIQISNTGVKASKGSKTDLLAGVGKVKDEDVKTGTGLNPEPQGGEEKGDAERRGARSVAGNQAALPKDEHCRVAPLQRRHAGTCEVLGEIELTRYSSLSELEKGIRQTSSGDLNSSITVTYLDGFGDALKLLPDCAWSTFVASVVTVIIS